MKFKIENTSKGTLARVGKLETPHGIVETPVFMPVATAGAVKTLSSLELEELGAQIILGNTYHLHIRPGEDLIDEFDGLHKWMNWDGPILTDSGGYQAFSLGATKGKLAKISEDDVRFYSHIDGAKLIFTPQKVIDIQNKLNSDIVMVLDDCAPYPATDKRLFKAVKRTGEWAKKSIDYWQERGLDKSGKGLFGIIQGGMNEELRKQSTKDINDLPFDGIAIGGVSVGESKENMVKTVDYIKDDIDPARPHYLMGVGEPDDLIRMVSRGMDMFDCVLPTRYARHGAFWTRLDSLDSSKRGGVKEESKNNEAPDYKRLDIKKSSMTHDKEPLDKNCKCITCQNYSRSYLRHLFLTKESLGMRAMSYHNLYVLFTLMKDIRSHIIADDFSSFYKKYI